MKFRVHNDKIRSMDSMKGVNWVFNDKKGHMVLKGVNWVHNDKIGSQCVLERSQ